MSSPSIAQLRDILNPDPWHRILGKVDVNDADWEIVARKAETDVARRAYVRLQQVVDKEQDGPEVWLRAVLLDVLKSDRRLLGPLGLAIESSEERLALTNITDAIHSELDPREWIWVFRSDASSRFRDTRILGLAPELDLRLRLGWRANRRYSARELVDDIALFPDLRRDRLRWLLEGFVFRFPATPRLSVRAFLGLPVRARLTLLESPELLTRLTTLTEEDVKATQRDTHREWQVMRALRRQIPHFLRTVRYRDWTQANRCSRLIAKYQYNAADLVGFGPLASQAVVMPTYKPNECPLRERRSGGHIYASSADWQPMPARVRLLVTELIGKEQLTNNVLDILESTRHQLLAKAIRDDSFLNPQAPQLPIADLRQLRATWNADEAVMLLRHGRSDLLSTISKESVLSRLDVLLPYLGTSEIERAVKAVSNVPHVAKTLTAAAAEAPLSAAGVCVGTWLRKNPSPQIIAECARYSNSSTLTEAVANIPAGLIEERIPLVQAASLSKSSTSRERIISRALQGLSGASTHVRRREIRALIATFGGWVLALALRNGLRKLTRDALVGQEDSKALELWRDACGFLKGLPQELDGQVADVLARIFPGVPDVVKVEIAVARPQLLPKLARELIRLNGRIVNPKADSLALAASAFAPRYGRPLMQSMPKDRIEHALPESLRILSIFPSRRAAVELAGIVGFNMLPRIAVVAATSARMPNRPGAKLDEFYRTYQLPKKSGGNRTITVPPIWLRTLQRRIYQHLLAPYGAHGSAYGFVPGRSIVSNAAQHVGRSLVVNCDISTAFPSTSWKLVLAALRRDLRLQCSRHVTSLITDICSYGGGLPIGAPTSPALLNRVLLRTDEILEVESRKRDVVYSRYADDMTFSGNRAGEMLPVTRRLLKAIGLSLDEKKTNLYRRGRRQIVTGLVVNDRVSIPRRIRRRLRAAVHRWKVAGTAEWHNRSMTEAELKGHLAYLRMVNGAEGEGLLAQMKRPNDADPPGESA